MCALCGGSPSEAAVDHAIDHPFELDLGTDNSCAACGRHLSVHPDKMDVLSKQTMDDIIKHGHQVRCIFDPEDGDRRFAYTVGRTVKNRPELFIAGPLPSETAATILNTVAERDLTEPLKAGQELKHVLDGGYLVRLIEVTDLSEAQMYGVTQVFSDAVALQVVWPDPMGNFVESDAQPLYGSLEVEDG